MLLVVDVGNTNIVFGTFQGAELTRHWRVSTTPERTADEYGAQMTTLLGLAGLSCGQVEGVIVSSVVPAAERALIHFARNYCRRSPLVVGPGIKTGMAIRYENPKEVGADRIVNAVAAFELVKGAAIVVDFGTATTFDLIGPEGEYRGGAIAPGLMAAMEALSQRTAKLPRIDFARPQSVVGRNTVDSMRSGLYWGYVGLVDGILRRMIEEADFKKAPKVLATGGLADVFGKDIKRIDVVDEFLTLNGLRILHERNQ